MKEREIILNKLLDKYERSKSYQEDTREKNPLKNE